MKPEDLVRLSTAPASLPLPDGRTPEDARAWASGSLPILTEFPGLMNMRVQRAMKKLISSDWLEGVIAMGEALESAMGQDWAFAHWWNNERIQENLIVLATYKRAPTILYGLATDPFLSNKIKDDSLGVALEQLADNEPVKAMAEDLLSTMIMSRAAFFQGKAGSPGGRLARALARGHDDELLVKLGAVPHLANLRGHWIEEGAVLARNGQAREKGAEPAEEHDILAVSQNPGILLNNEPWQAWGATLLLIYMEHAPAELPGIVKMYSPLIDNPRTRGSVRALEAWERKRRLVSMLGDKTTPTPGRRGGM